MPELPEVETVRQTLQKQIIGKKITDIKIYYDRILENISATEFKKSLIGQTFKKMDRYGKYLFFILDTYTLIVHLRMEGKFFLKKIDDELNKHEHIVFILDDQISFRYHDTRKFGRMVVLKTIKKAEIMKYPALAKLGKEANDTHFTKEELYDKLKKKKEFIKGALLDQSIICGLGNIYVDEVCFMSKINPSTMANRLNLDDVGHLLDSSITVLAKAIKAGGTTIRSYTSSLGVTGLFQLELLVHDKENKPCPICGTIIKKEFVCGRGTYFCPKCQKIKGPKVIGITGSIATGKSVVTTYLKKQGYEVLDADEIVREEKKPQGLLYEKLIKVFSNQILDENGNINDQMLSRMVYHDEKMRKKINALIHPIVFTICEKKIAKSSAQIIFLSVPLLFEAGFDVLCDEIWCVYLQSDVQVDRLMKRNHITEEEAKQRIQIQMSQEEKCQKSTYIIDNSRELCYTIEQIQKILNK